MKNFKRTIIMSVIIIGIFIQPISASAQGGQRQRMDPAQMVAAEKQIVLDSITDLNDEQKLIINEIYKDYEESLTTMRASADQGNREEMRAAMTSLRNEKNESLKAILTEPQYLKYDAMMKAIREKMGQGRRREGGQ
jgi:hypothetical protein